MATKNGSNKKATRSAPKRVKVKAHDRQYVKPARGSNGRFIKKRTGAKKTTKKKTAPKAKRAAAKVVNAVQGALF